MFCVVGFLVWVCVLIGDGFLIVDLVCFVVVVGVEFFLVSFLVFVDGCWFFCVFWVVVGEVVFYVLLYMVYDGGVLLCWRVAWIGVKIWQFCCREVGVVVRFCSW